MGSDKREEQKNTLRKPRESSQVGHVADWGSVDAKVLLRAVEIASKKSGALRLGYTRDGGAFAIGVYAGATYFTDYVRPNEDIEQYLLDLTASFEDYDGSTQSVPERTGSKRR